MTTLKQLREGKFDKPSYDPKVGDQVRVPTHKQTGQTIGGQVSRIGRTMIHVKHSDGEVSAHPKAHVFPHDLGSKEYQDWSGK